MNSNLWKEIWDNIKEVMKSRKLKGSHIAIKAWITKSYISEIIHGNRIPSIETLHDVCNAIWIDIHVLFTKIYLEQWKKTQGDNYEEIKAAIDELKLKI